MDENNRNTNDLNDPNSVQRFEMGDDPQPKINHYNQDRNVVPEQKTEPVNPNNGLPIPPQQEPISQNTSTPQVPTPPPKKTKKTKKKSTKAALMVFLSVFAGFLVLFLILSFVFLAQAGENQSGLAKLLNLNQATFINGLIAFINFIFILLALIAFLFTVIFFFKAFMAKKDDKETKKNALKKTFISGSILFFIFLIWAFSLFYLDNKRVPEGPAANLEFIQTQPEETLQLTAPVDIRFDASNIPLDRQKYQIVSHQWDFGDNTTGTNQIVSHQYDQIGTYEVTLTINVQDKETGEILVGGQYFTTVSVTNQELSASFTADPQTGEAPLTVELDASESIDPDGEIDRFDWDLSGNNIFDDAEGEKITHEFQKVGTYEVSLRVTNKTGEFKVHTQKIVVTDKEEPTPLIEIQDEPSAFQTGVAYLFTAENSTTPNEQIEKYLWDFGDKTPTSTSKNVSHTYKFPGTYQVSLSVTDDQGKSATAEKEITIAGPQGIPDAKILTQPAIQTGQTALQGTVPFSVIFDARASTDPDNNIVEYKWNLDGSTPQESYGDVTEMTFDTAGTYNVTLSVTDADGNVNSTTQIIKAEAQGIIAKLVASPLEGSAPLTVSFDASGSSYQNGQITSYKWDFGDGTQPQLNASQMTHRFNEIGTYNTQVTVIGADGAQESVDLAITVREIALTACFNSTFLKGSAPLITQFDPSCSTGAASSYFWDFGDGTTANEVKPDHTFENPGNYTVTLEITDNNSNVSSFDKVIEVIR